MRAYTRSNYDAIPVRSLNESASGPDNADVNTVAANLRAALGAYGISENELSRRTGVPQPTIHRVLKGKALDPRDGTLRPMAQFFGVTVEELRTADEGVIRERAREMAALPVRTPIRSVGVREIEGPDYNVDREATVPEVELRLSGGSGSAVPEFVEVRGNIPFQRAWFQRFGARPEAVRLLRVTGSSMEPLLYENDRVAVNFEDTKIVSDHVYAIVLDQDAKIKRLQRTGRGIRIISDNPDRLRYPDDYVTDADAGARGFLVLGRVIDRSGSGGL